MAIIRKTDSIGRIVVPKEIRKMYKIDIGHSIEYLIENNNTLVMRKYDPSCIFCNSMENIRLFKQKYACDKCINEM